MLPHSRTLTEARPFPHENPSIFRYKMSLVTCGRFFRPYLGQIRPVLVSSRLNGCRRFSSLQKRPNFAAGRLQAIRQASDGGQSSGPLGENAALAVGIGLLGGSLFYVSMHLIIHLLDLKRVFYHQFTWIIHILSSTLNPLFLSPLSHPWGKISLQP